MRRWFTDRPTITTLLILALAAGPVYFRSEAIDSQRAADQTEARVAACEQYNEQQDRSRDGNKAQIRVIFGFLTALGDGQDDEERAALEELYQLHDSEIDKSFPDRDCSPDGIEEFYEENQP